MQEAQARRENVAINVVRAAAALLVAISHLRNTFFQDYARTAHSPLKALVYAPLSLGHEAVILFFVLSGYWVGGGAVRAIARRRFSWRTYGVNRLTRLWVVLIPALVLTVVLDEVGARLLPDASVYRSPGLYILLPPHPSHSLMTFLANVGSLQSLHAPVYGYDSPLWSLAYEFWYYLLFPAALLAFRRAMNWRVRIVNATVLLFAVAIGGRPAMALFTAWLLGAVVAWQRPRIIESLMRAKRRRLAVARGGAVVATLLAMLVSRQAGALPWAEALVIGVPTAALLSLLAVDLEWKGWPAIALRAFGRLAHSSYSLYAIHVPLLAFAAAALVPDANRRWNMDLPHAGAGVLVLTGVVFTSVCFARLTEQRTGELRGRLLARTHAPPPADPIRA